MKLIQVLKLLWREIICIKDKKISFFHGNETLINKKQFDYLYRMGRNGVFEMLFYISKSDLLTLKTKDGIIVETNRDYGTFIDVFLNKLYSLPFQINNDFCVFDLGMNRGYASLFFANYPNCKEVFGFELVPKTYEWAVRNFAMNPTLVSKITPHCFGMWNEDREIEIRFRDYDVYTTIDSLLLDSPGIKKSFKNIKSQICNAKVKKASTEISNILRDIPAERMKVLKIDIEGSEYVVFEDLHTHNILDEFDLIIGECHNGMDGLNKYMNNFNLIHKSKSEGLILMFTYLNNRIAL